MDLKELRDLAGELGMELIYMVGQSKLNFEKVTYDNFSEKKHIGLLRNGKIFMQPIRTDTMLAKLLRAVNRKKKARLIERTQEQAAHDAT